ncbi:MAG: LCP family protein [Frisingicoccus sp.]|uniref:LCP family protein n=1 Tax=Frisingicoccus sp. TaxID=1918627 RepID=UPI002A82B734|nr:LCP family protein [Frisingicoccus sp.]MDY4835729.1 LCP family protein [Frisingicoccus sp.]
MTNTRKRRRRRKSNRHTIGKVMAIIQIVLSVVFMAVLFMINVLPMKYMAIVFGILMFLDMFSLGSQFTRSAHVIGKIDCILMCVLLILGNVYLIRTNATLFSITNNTYKVDRIAIAVLNSDSAQTIEDASGYTFGAQVIGGSDKVEQAIDQITKELGQDLYYENYEDPYAMVQNLYDGNIQAIIYNTAYDSSLTERFPTFSQDIRELKHIEIKTEVQNISGDKKDVTKVPFTVFISGIDTEGSISTTSRSDVNMLVTVNPTTHQILMTSIPRDYYVQLPGVSGEYYDKLTHAGLYGADCSMNTLSQLFGIDIDYYAKVNFTTLRDMVNALGGVDLDSRYEFTTISGEYFVEGMNYDVDGSSALAFARERYNLPNGDNDRVINQQIVLKAIINKCMSPAILTGYMGIMDSLSDSFETSLSQQQISSLVRMQLDQGSGWEILSSRVVGTGDENTCYSSGDNLLYVMVPDYSSVETVAGFINRMKSGETLSADEIAAAMNY